MNMKYQKNYMNLMTPEVIKALQEEYSPDRTFIYTKRLLERIVANPKTFPLLSKYPQRHITHVISTCLQQNGMTRYANRSHRGGGIVFVRVIPSDKN